MVLDGYLIVEYLDPWLVRLPYLILNPIWCVASIFWFAWSFRVVVIENVCAPDHIHIYIYIYIYLCMMRNSHGF